MTSPKKASKSKPKRQRYTLGFKQDVENWIEAGAKNIGIAPIDFIRIKINESMKCDSKYDTKH